MHHIACLMRSSETANRRERNLRAPITIRHYCWLSPQTLFRYSRSALLRSYSESGTPLVKVEGLARSSLVVSFLRSLASALPTVRRPPFASIRLGFAQASKLSGVRLTGLSRRVQKGKRPASHPR